MQFKLKEIIDVVSGRLVSGDPEIVLSGVSIDTRSFDRGQLFVAIRGAHFDGHNFLNEAKGTGALAALIKKGAKAPQGLAAIEVDDTEKALGDIAMWWRGRFSIPCVAITGSNGKSTTKEMIAAIASSLGPVLKTEGNFNNTIGLPLTVFRLDESHRAAILEMGMNAPGEIRRLAKIADPDIGLITNVTAAHLERLHTIGMVAKAKGELFEAMRRSAVAIINGEDKNINEISTSWKGKRIVFGMQNDFDVSFLHMDTNGLDSMELKFKAMAKVYSMKLPVTGAHNVMNALAAVSVGLALGIKAPTCIEKLANFKPMAMRMENLQLANGVRVVNDSYNATPESMRAALRTVGTVKRAGRFIAALGDMLELGDSSDELHRQLGMDAVKMGAARLYLRGDFAKAVASGAIEAGLSRSQIVIIDGDPSQMGKVLERELKPGDVLLVKGSRRMRMERVVEYLKGEIGTG